MHRGDITAGTIRSMWEAGMILGITADSTILGTMEAGAGITGTATIITRTTAAGTEAGIRTMGMGISTGTDIFTTSRAVPVTTSTSEDRGIRPVPTGYLPEAVHSAEAQV